MGQLSGNEPLKRNEPDAAETGDDENRAVACASIRTIDVFGANGAHIIQSLQNRTAKEARGDNTATGDIHACGKQQRIEGLAADHLTRVIETLCCV